MVAVDDVFGQKVLLNCAADHHSDQFVVCSFSDHAVPQFAIFQYSKTVTNGSYFPKFVEIRLWQCLLSQLPDDGKEPLDLHIRQG